MGRKNKRKKSAYYRKLRMTSKMYPMRQASGIPKCSEHTAEHKDVSQSASSRPVPSPGRGEIWFAEFINHPGTSVQKGCRPALIVSNDVSNQYAETVTVVPMTTRIKKPHLPTHVIAAPEDVDTAAGQHMELSMLLGEQVTTIGKRELIRYVGRIHSKKLREVEAAILAQMDIGMSDDAGTLAATDVNAAADAATATGAAMVTKTDNFEKEGRISYGS